MAARNPRELTEDIAALRERFTSLEAMAQALRAHPGFERLNRATLMRWLKRPSARAKAAVEILTSRRDSSARIRIAQTNSLSAIPMAMLHWDGESRPYGLLGTQYGVRTEVHESRHGGPALELLVND